MNIHGFFTRKGLELSAKLLAGTALNITRVVAGSGQTGETADALAQSCQTLAVNTPLSSGDTATIPVTLTAAQASGDYTLTELGVYAKDPDAGEILYKVYRLDAPVEVTAGSSAVLRFYLRETVSNASAVTVSCSPAGLITETEFVPVQTKLQAARVSARDVHVTADELPAYIAALPRMLTESLWIYVSGGTIKNLSITNFYGSGSLYIQSADHEDPLVITGTLTVGDCAVNIRLNTLTFQTDTTASNAVFGYRASNCSFESCTFQDVGGGHTALCVQQGKYSLTYAAISGYYSALQANVISFVSVYGSFAGENNTVGIHVYRGGIVLLGESNIPTTLGGTSNKKQGGLIAAYGGTLL